MMGTGVVVHGRVVVVAVGWSRAVETHGRRPFARQRVAEHAGRPVTARVHGTAADGHGGPAVPGVRAADASGRRPRRVPRPVAGAALRLGGHAHVAARRPGVRRGGRPGRRPPRARAGRRHREGRGRGGRNVHRTSAAAAVHRRTPPAADVRADAGPRRPAPVVRRQLFRPVIVPLRRHRLHGPAATVARELVIAWQRGPGPLGVRPHGKTGPVHRQAVKLLAGTRASRPRALRRCRPRSLATAVALYVQRFVRLPAQSTGVYFRFFFGFFFRIQFAPFLSFRICDWPENGVGRVFFFFYTNNAEIARTNMGSSYVTFANYYRCIGMDV